MTQIASGHRTSAGRVISSVFSNYAGFAIRVATTLVTTPLFINALGQSLYGSWVLLWSIAAYLTFFDLGIGMAVRKFVAQAIATGDLGERDRKFNACLSIYLLISILVVIIGLPFIGLLGNTVGLDASVRPMIWKISIFLVLDVALAFPLNAFQGLLTAYQRYELTNAIRVGMEVLRNVFLVVAASMGADLTVLASIQFVSTVLTLILIWAASVHIARPLKLKLFRLDSSIVRDISSYSGWVAVLSAAQQVLNLSSSVLVGYFDTAMVVTEFYVAYRLVSFLVGLPGLMTSVLMPLSSERDAVGDWTSLQRVFMIGNNAQALILAPIVAGAMLLGGEFFHVWLGPGFERSAFYLILLVIPILVTQGTAGSIALGAGREKFIAIITGISALFTMISACLAGKVWGVEGICYAYGGTSIITNAIIFIVFCRYLQLAPWLSFLKIWAGPVFCAAVQVLAIIAVESLFPEWRGLGRFLATVAYSLVAYGIAVGLSFRWFPNYSSACRKLFDVFRTLPVGSFLRKRT